jgi:hypothetical protein
LRWRRRWLSGRRNGVGRGGERLHLGVIEQLVKYNIRDSLARVVFRHPLLAGYKCYDFLKRHAMHLLSPEVFFKPVALLWVDDAHGLEQHAALRLGGRLMIEGLQLLQSVTFAIHIKSPAL